MSTGQVIPSGSSNNFGGYLWLLMSFLSFAPDYVGATYLGMSLIETPLGATYSTTPKLDGPIYAVPSPCTLEEVHVCLFYDGVELGFWAFCFPLGIEEDPTGMLMTSSTNVMGRTGDSGSLEILTVSGFLSMPHFSIFTM